MDAGYPTHFGQLECMKLIASPHFPEKRIGYLGMMLLLSEEADVLMLATNALKNDLNNDNRFISGLALCAISNLATADMSRDLAPEVDKHLSSSQPYLRKKACLAMARCLTKCPEMAEDYAERVITLLKDRSHGVLITVVQLMTQVLIMDQKIRDEEGEDDDDNEEESPVKTAFLRVIPFLVKLLRNLLTTGYSPDHDIAGISDPFLQVQILTLFRLLGAGNQSASEEMDDVLAQVATNTESAKNSGNAILYECVQTIMAIESDDKLRVLAVNILGRFLLNKDNNIRYVALNTLSKCIADQKEAAREDPNSSNSADGPNSAAVALQRHRTTIVDCLKDPDISIRQRALELIYHLVNSENVESLTGELLNYLVLCPREHRTDICSRVLRVVEKYCPDDMWRVDTLITMLTIAGRECSRNVLSSTIIYISHSSEDLRAYATHKLLKAIRDDDGTQRGLLIVGVWCIGEYGDLLLKPYSYTPKSTGNALPISFMALEPASVVSTIENISKHVTCPMEVKERVITCFTKLSDRFANVSDTATLEKIHDLVKQNSKSQSLELQLHSCEYDALLNAVKGIAMGGENKSDDIFGGGDSSKLSAEVIAAAKESLAKMPVVDLTVIKRKKASEFDEQDGGDEDVGVVATSAPAPGGDLLDLADIFGGGDSSSAPVAATQQNGAAPISENKSANETEKSDVDLLSDIFSAPPVTSNVMPTMAPVPSQPVNMFAPTPTAQMNAQVPLVASNGIDIFSSTAPVAQPQQTSMPSIDVFGTNPGPTPTPTPTTSMNDVFGTTAPQQPTQTNISMPAAATPAAAPAASEAVIVPGFSHQGISVQFECTKPDVWNKQKSILVAKMSNTTDSPIYGFNLQCAVPKYVTMEMKPPTSTTIPVTTGAKQITQTINVTNTMLGTKNLMLKLKVSFTSKGTKIEHMATCASFPAGQY